MKNLPTIEEVKGLDGKIFATLNASEETVLKFFRTRGRQYGVDIQIIKEADPKELSAARSMQEADQILKRSNSRIQIIVREDSWASGIYMAIAFGSMFVWRVIGRD